MINNERRDFLNTLGVFGAAFLMQPILNKIDAKSLAKDKLIT